MKSGDLDRRIDLQKRIDVADGLGNTKGSFTSRGIVWGNIKYLRGGEAVMGARLQAKQPVIITVRKSSTTDLITADWRVVIDGEAFNVREHPTPSDNRLYLQFLAESGVASG